MDRQELRKQGYRWYQIIEWGDKRYIQISDIKLRPGLQLVDVLEVCHNDLYNDNMLPGAWVNVPDEGRYYLVYRNNGQHSQYTDEVLPIEVRPGNYREAKRQLMDQLEAQDGYGLSTAGV